ncbi:taste receptor type 2 member 1-like [Sceloporus undulatus]|uniref:taste receptor type 2 member 1-like n=1 Tax=Sceloporus undulatus TaxID=8520 RepID=UPI001C4CFBC7|nr:taste receptor type 2 member 1-like [Sceloporus undulatus]
MASLMFITFVITSAVLATSGLISNGFIIIMIAIEWAKSRSLASSDQLFLSLSLSNIWAIVLLLPFYIDDFLMFSFTGNLVLKILFPIVVFVVISRFWLTAWLCIFYCIKIVNSTHSCFLWCKRRISWLLPRLLVGSLVFAFFASLSALQIGPVDLQSNTTGISMMNQGKTLKDSAYAFQIFFFIIGSSSPLLAVVLCSTLVVASLFRHVCRIISKENFRSLQRGAHIKAAGTVLSLLLLYLSYFVAQTLSVIADLRKSERFLISLVMMIYSPAQAAILVLNNPKLKQAITVMIQRRKP